MSHLSIFWKLEVKLGISISFPCLSSWYRLPPASAACSRFRPAGLAMLTPYKCVMQYDRMSASA